MSMKRSQHTREQIIQVIGTETVMPKELIRRLGELTMGNHNTVDISQVKSLVEEMVNDQILIGAQNKGLMVNGLFSDKNDPLSPEVKQLGSRREEHIDKFLALPYNEQRDILIRSMRSIGKTVTNAEWRQKVFERCPSLLRKFYSDPIVMDMMIGNSKGSENEPE